MYSLGNIYDATMMKNGSLHAVLELGKSRGDGQAPKARGAKGVGCGKGDVPSPPGRVLGRRQCLSPVKTGPQNGGFSRNVKTLDFIFQTPKATSLRGTASFDVFCVKVSVGASVVGERMNPHKNRNNNRTCIGGDIRNIITLANFRIDRLRGFSVARGQILGFAIGFRRRPYNNLALPRECVIRMVIFEILVLFTQYTYSHTHRSISLPVVTFTRRVYRNDLPA